MPLTEDQIERRVEKMTDDIDRRFMAGQLTQKQYSGEIKDLAKWADAQYFANKRIGESK